MAKSKKSDADLSAVKVDDINTKEQDEALLHYRLTGERGAYIDTHRDQEPDIAPEAGVHPDPQQTNPAVVDSPFATVASGPVVDSFSDKEDRAKDEEERVQAFADSENEANKKADVDAPETTAGDVLNRHLTSDESPKAADTSPGR